MSEPKNAVFKRVLRNTGGLIDDTEKDPYNNSIIEAFQPDQVPKKNWYNKKKFNAQNEKDYYKKEHLNEVEDMINLGSGGLY